MSQPSPDRASWIKSLQSKLVENGLGHQKVTMPSELPLRGVDYIPTNYGTDYSVVTTW